MLRLVVLGCGGTLAAALVLFGLLAGAPQAHADVVPPALDALVTQHQPLAPPPALFFRRMHFDLAPIGPPAVDATDASAADDGRWPAWIGLLLAAVGGAVVGGFAVARRRNPRP